MDQARIDSQLAKITPNLKSRFIESAALCAQPIKAQLLVNVRDDRLLDFNEGAQYQTGHGQRRESSPWK